MSGSMSENKKLLESMRQKTKQSVVRGCPFEEKPKVKKPKTKPGKKPKTKI